MFARSSIRQAQPGTAAPSLAWHALSGDAVLAGLSSSRQGLSDHEARARQATYGNNRLPVAPRVSALEILGNQLRSVVVLLLVAAAALSLAIGDHVEAAAIAVVLVINAGLGFTTDWRARQAMAALLQLEAPRALVLRDARLRAIAAEHLVPGDVVQLDAGNKVPADVRLIEAADLSIDEAPLTGESLAVEKAADPIDAATIVADRRNMAYMGTTAVSGTGFAVVTGTGAQTELGKIGSFVSSIQPEPTPLERRLDVLGRRLAWLTIAIVGLISVVGLAHDVPWPLVLQTGIALAVAAMPEALPAVATIALAVGMRRMARRHALVRRLPSVESLGSATVVCTDKTRTLTTGEMTVVSVWIPFEQLTLEDAVTASHKAHRLLEIAALASQPQVTGDTAERAGLANPVDVAVLATLPLFGTNADDLLRRHPRRGILPFSSARKMMASFHEDGAGILAFVKGAPAAVLPMCSALRFDRGRRPLEHGVRADLQRVNETLARDGLRMIAVASGDARDQTDQALHDLTFEGFIGIADPVAAGVPSTVALLRAAGLRTVMITGDQRGTAEAVARQVGLMDGPAHVLDGRDLSTMSPGELDERIPEISVFSRVSPEHKLTIVSALQQRGDIVAMLGDGVNDAAALKKADVGVAMGLRGTDVARQASAIVLQDDRFETIAAAVEEGRIIFDNIRKFVFYLFSCNVAEVLILLVAGLAAWPLPLQPLQLLWLNLVTDTFPALALAMEPGDRSVMTRPPRDPHEAILSWPFVTSILLYGGVITLATLASFWWILQTRPAAASTAAFMTLALAQIGHLGNARSDDDVLNPTRAAANRFALGAVALAVALQLATYLSPVAAVVKVVALDAREWLLVAGCAAIPAVAGQFGKLLRARGSTSAWELLHRQRG